MATAERAYNEAMRVVLPYADTHVTLAVPDRHLAGVVEPAWPGALDDPRGAVRQALTAPVASPPLAALVRERMAAAGPAPRTCILVSDLTRPCPTPDVLLPLLGALEDAGAPAAGVTVLVAAGLHAPTCGRDLVRLLGPEVLGRVRVLNHMSREPDTLVDLGPTERGTPVLLARPWVEADLRIATGVVEPHLMAGFGGGRKAVCPGVAGEATVMAWHSPALLEHPRTRPGVLEGNPEHEEALAVADRCPPHLILNVTVSRGMRLTGVFAGAMREAHAAAVAHLRDHAARPVAAPCDVLVASSGGRPLDKSLYGAEKGILPGLAVLKPGGTILWVAGLEGGLGSPEFAALCRRYATLEAFLEAVTAPGAPVTKDQWALENLSKALRHAGEVLLWSDRCPPEVQAEMFVHPVASLEAGLARAIARHGPDTRVLVLPWGPYTLPYLEEEGRP